MIMMTITFSKHYFSSSYRCYLLNFLLLPILTMTVQTVSLFNFSYLGSVLGTRPEREKLDGGSVLCLGLCCNFSVDIQIHMSLHM